MTYITSCESETLALGVALGGVLRGGDVVALTGGLGSGKTVFARGVAEGLGVRSPVTSPTFAIVNEYQGDAAMFHFDLYRLASARELIDIGWDDYLDRGGVIVVEWSDVAGELIPDDAVRARFECMDGDRRRIELDAPGRGALL
jgi:tRNA threonylcarbamoyladenosine biosynthesis protein TsaE